jgi:hypothetical protein
MTSLARRRAKATATPGLRAVILFVVALLLMAVRCDQDVPLGVDPGRDAGPVDASAAD